MQQYYKINRRGVSICALLLFLCFVSQSFVSQSFAFPICHPLLVPCFKFTSVHTFLQEQITILECQPLEWDHQTSNVIDCKKKLSGYKYENENEKSVCFGRGGGGGGSPRERQFIQSVKNSFCRVPVLSFKTSCEHVVYVVWVHGSMSVWQQRCHQPSPIWVHQSTGSQRGDGGAGVWEHFREERVSVLRVFWVLVG